MSSNTKNITLYTGLILSASVALITAAKYIYLYQVSDPENLMMNASRTDLMFFSHFYQWLIELRISFLFHIIFGGIALLIGPLQLIKPAVRMKKIHQSLGTLYFLSVFLSASGGLMIAGDALGGIPARFGFTFAGVFWLGTLLISGWMLAAKDFKKHGVWMKMNFSLTFAAVTLRLEQPLLHLIGFEPEASYQIVSWMSWIPNLIFALVYLKPVKNSILSVRETAALFSAMTAGGIIAAGRLIL